MFIILIIWYDGSFWETPGRPNPGHKFSCTLFFMPPPATTGCGAARRSPAGRSLCCMRPLPDATAGGHPRRSHWSPWHSRQPPPHWQPAVPISAAACAAPACRCCPRLPRPPQLHAAAPASCGGIRRCRCDMAVLPPPPPPLQGVPLTPGNRWEWIFIPPPSCLPARTRNAERGSGF